MTQLEARELLKAIALREAREVLDAVRYGAWPGCPQDVIDRALRVTGDIKTCPPCFGDCNQGRECPARGVGNEAMDG